MKRCPVCSGPFASEVRYGKACSRECARFVFLAAVIDEAIADALGGDDEGDQDEGALEGAGEGA